MKRTSITSLFISAMVLAATPIFAQEESLFQEDPVIQEQIAAQEETLITEAFDEPLFQEEAVEQSPVQVVYKRIMSESNARVLNDLKKQTQNKANSIISRNKSRKTPDQLIEGIEGLKQQYLQQASGLSDSDDAYIQELKAKCEAEIQARMLEEQRLAELESDGVTLNTRGQKRLENDLNAIQEKYQKQIDSHRKSSAGAKTQQALLSQIASAVRSLESSTYVQSSISDENLVLSIGEYDGTRDLWPYTVTLYLSGRPVATYAGNLSYTDISGKKIPQVPQYSGNAGDPKVTEYQKYLDSVEIFDEAFKDDPLFIEAQISYTVKAKNPSEASSYTVTVNSVQLKNIITDKVINTYSKREQLDFAYSPESPVDWTAATAPAATQKEKESAAPKFPKVRDPILDSDIRNNFSIFPPISIVINVPDSKDREEDTSRKQEAEERKESKKETPSTKRDDSRVSNSNVENTRATASYVEADDKKNSVSALLYCLPGTVNFYSTPDGSEGALTLGYNLQFSVCPRLFLGLNLEFGLFESGLFSLNNYASDGSGSSTGSSSKTYYFDEIFFDTCCDSGFYLVTGQIGSYFNLNKNIRFNYFGEAGICSDTFIAGAGCSFEFYSNTLNWGGTIGYTGLVWDDFTYLNKISLGVEVLF